MIAIVLADKNWGIAKNEKQILYIKDDLKRFRQMTMGHTVIFGRKTLEKFPGGKPLKGRQNICLSRVLESTDNMQVIRNIDELNLKDHVCSFCIGGESVYKQLYPHFTAVYVTRVLRDLEADQFFPTAIEDDFYLLASDDVFYDQDSGVHYTNEIYLRKA